MYDFSPNSCLQYGVLALNLLIHWGASVLPRADDPHFCHTSAVILTFSNHQFSECCCGSRKSPLYVLRHVRPSSLGCQNLAVVPAILKMRNCVISLRPLLSSKSFSNESNYKHSWTVPFLSSSVDIDFSSQNVRNYMHSESFPLLASPTHFRGL